MTIESLIELTEVYEIQMLKRHFYSITFDWNGVEMQGNKEGNLELYNEIMDKGTFQTHDSSEGTYFVVYHAGKNNNGDKVRICLVVKSKGVKND